MDAVCIDCVWHRFVTSMTDWFFAGDWIHQRLYLSGNLASKSETRAIVASARCPFLPAASLPGCIARLGVHSVTSALLLAVAVVADRPVSLDLD